MRAGNAGARQRDKYIYARSAGASEISAKPAAGGSSKSVVRGQILYLKLGNMQNPQACSTPTSLLLSASHTGFKELYATILATQTSGSQIAVLYDGCDAGPGFPLISAIASPAAW